MTVSLEQINTALDAQWARTIDWLEPLGQDLHGQADNESSAQGWTVAQLITHMGMAMDVLITAQPVTEPVVKLNLAEYLRSYSDQSQAILERSRNVEQRATEALLNYLSAQANAVSKRLGEFGTDPDLVLQTSSTAIELHDLAAASLIEVVVHSLDLELSFTGTVDMAGGRIPVHPDSLRLVAQILLDVLSVRGATGLEVKDPRRWVLLATGRAPHTISDISAALSPSYTAGGIEDLGPYLPLI